MAEVPDDRRYTKEHEWALQQGERILVGITDYAQDQLGDVVFVGLPDLGSEVHAGQPLGEVESTKSVSDVYSPVSGKVVARNEDVEQNPEVVNSDPYGAGWLIAVEAGEGGLEGLMEAADYRSFIEEEGD
ncbi:MAG TPA: glycine cleavage system protein GcvH [Actinomycetota bacterium]|jgi:glycine cleavage system H protein|nr:glycine cleavage system protein GcvH [Actinomycetota bacterium]